MRILFLCFFLLQFSSGLLLAQNNSSKIIGKILSSRSDIANVHVRNMSTNKGTITNASGNFEIKVSVYDTLFFSAVQFKRKILVITPKVLQSNFVLVTLEEFTNELDEVVLRPYDLSGELSLDVNNIHVGPIITETTLKLPNAHLKPPTQNERKLYTARTWDFKIVSIKLDPIINYFSGRTKMLNKRVARDLRNKKLDDLYAVIPDSLFIEGLLIPHDHIYRFLFFCEADPEFKSLIVAEDSFAIWKFLGYKSVSYRENNTMN